MLLAAIMAEVQFRRGTFKDSVEFRHQLDLMAEWLTDSGNSKFGILLCGPCGNGKSTWVKALQHLIGYLQIPDNYMGGTYGLTIVKTNDITEQSQEEMFKDIHRLGTYQLLAIDDLCTEPKEVMHYGNISSPMIRLIDKRYDEQLFTIITTNLTPPEIKAVYGERTSDRLAEMMQVLPFDNPSYRSIKPPAKPIDGQCTARQP